MKQAEGHQFFVLLIAFLALLLSLVMFVKKVFTIIMEDVLHAVMDVKSVLMHTAVGVNNKGKENNNI